MGRGGCVDMTGISANLLGTANRAEGEGSGQEGDGVREIGREPQTGETPRGQHGPGSRPRAEKGGQTDAGNGGRRRHMERDPRGQEIPGEQIEGGKEDKRRDEWRRLAGGGCGHCPGGQSLCTRRLGCKKRVIHREVLRQ